MEYLSSTNTLGAFGIIALIIAIAVTILTFIFIVPEKKRARMNAFGKFLHDTCNFKYLIVEKILQALYIFLTAYVILCGFFMLFMTTKSFWGATHWLGGYGLLLMILGPIAVRLIYELIMMTVLLVKNVISINNKLRDQNDGGAARTDVFAGPDMSGVKASLQHKMNQMNASGGGAPTAGPKFCARCGAPLAANGRCPRCDAPQNPTMQG